MPRRNASIQGKDAQHVRWLFVINIGPVSVTRKVIIKLSWQLAAKTGDDLGPNVRSKNMRKHLLWLSIVVGLLDYTKLL